MKEIPFKELNDSESQLLTEARDAQSLAYAPYSNFKVGVSILMKNGVILQGANQENAAYPMCLCGEQVALSHAKMSFPEEIITTICISTSIINDQKNPPSPCGACRQVISEYEYRQKKNIRIICEGADKVYSFESVDEILPYSFTSDHLDA